MKLHLIRASHAITNNQAAQKETKCGYKVALEM